NFNNLSDIQIYNLMLFVYNYIDAKNITLTFPKKYRKLLMPIILNTFNLKKGFNNISKLTEMSSITLPKHNQFNLNLTDKRYYPIINITNNCKHFGFCFLIDYTFLYDVKNVYIINTLLKKNNHTFDYIVDYFDNSFKILIHIL